jgi:hypothetical protein
MDCPLETDEIGRDFSKNDEPWHQDDVLGAQRRCICAWTHDSNDNRTQWSVCVSIGLATDGEKAPLVAEIATAGTPLDENYFLHRENLELWIDNQLAGLCRYSSRSFGPDDLMGGASEPLAFDVTLDAVFVRPMYHSLGFGEMLSEIMAEQILAGILTRMHGRRSLGGDVTLTMNADFNSCEGERFFENIIELISANMATVSKSLGVAFKMIVDAGY